MANHTPNAEPVGDELDKPVEAGAADNSAKYGYIIDSNGRKVYQPVPQSATEALMFQGGRSTLDLDSGKPNLQVFQRPWAKKLAAGRNSDGSQIVRAISPLNSENDAWAMSGKAGGAKFHTLFLPQMSSLASAAVYISPHWWTEDNITMARIASPDEVKGMTMTLTAALYDYDSPIIGDTGTALKSLTLADADGNSSIALDKVNAKGQLTRQLFGGGIGDIKEAFVPVGKIMTIALTITGQPVDADGNKLTMEQLPFYIETKALVRQLIDDRSF